MVPIAAVLGRGRYLDDIRAMTARVAATGEPYRGTAQDGRRQLVGDPLASFAGLVHGVWAWTGKPGEEPPPRDPAGAWYFNLTTGKIGGSPGLLDLYGVAAEDRREERLTAEAFGRLVPNSDQSSALALIVQAVPGMEHQATWTVRRDDGELRAVNFACRVVAEPGGDVVARGITHDIGPAESTSSAPRHVMLAQQVLAAEKEPGRWRAIVNIRTFGAADLGLLEWVDDPMPGIAWKNDSPYPPAIHPDDRAMARAMSERLATEVRVSETLRLRAVTGEWIAVAVTARLMLLDQHTTAALVMLEAAS
jgi:hypothetical protein